MKFSFLSFSVWMITTAGRSWVAAEVFTAMADIEELLYIEGDVVGVVDEYVEAEFERLRRLKEENVQKESISSSPELMANPVDAFITAKRFAQDWAPIEQVMHENLAEEFLHEVAESHGIENLKFPNEEDFQGAAVAIFRLQDTYNLSSEEMASGDLHGVKAANELTAQDCFELGRIALNVQNDSYHTINWMTEALRRLAHENGSAANESDILDYLGYALFKQGNVRHALEVTERLYERDPNHPRTADWIDHYYKLLDEADEEWDNDESLPAIENKRPFDHGLKDRGIFEELCRGDVEMPPEKLSKLHCAYKRDTPFLKLAPFKYEVAHVRPTLYVFNAWLRDEDDTVVERVNRRISDMTGYDLKHAELLQIANYGLGGHYDPHYDAANQSDIKLFGGNADGNRIATVLIYMSQPEAGGATVFLEPKVTVFPSKSDALFWNNLYPNGDRDEATRHAGCPVLSGTKWIANKWIREHGQQWRRPCALTRDYYD